MPKWIKIVLLVVLLIVTLNLFQRYQGGANPQAEAFFAFVSVGLLVAIVWTALRRSGPGRR